MEENAVEVVTGDPNAGTETTAETAVQTSADIPPNDNRTVCVGTRDLDHEVARAVQQSGTLTLQGDISVGNSINRSHNVHNDNRVYKPIYGDVHQHVTYNVQTKYFSRGDTRSNEQGDDSHVREGEGSHVIEGGAVTTRQRKPKKKTPPRKLRKARVPYNYKLAQNRTKPAQEREVTPPTTAFPWMTGATVACVVAVCGLVLWVWLHPGSLNITEYAETTGGPQRNEETSLPTVSKATTTSKQDNDQSKTDMDHEQGSKTTTTSPLHDACRGGKLGDIDKLLHAGTADINTRTRSGGTCLHIACEGGRLDIVDYLVRHNASINARNKLGRTPLHEASRNGHADIVRKLCQHGADVNAVDTEGKTPLTEASAHGHSVIVTILTQHGADVNKHSIFDLGSNALKNMRRNMPQIPEIKLPLMSAVEFGHDDIVAHLLEKQAQVNVPNKQGWMEIHMAAFNGNLSIVEKLVDKGADVHAVTERGATPLILASQEGHAKVVFFLLQQGADANHTQADGATAMMLAAENGREEVVRVLRDHWAAATATLNGKHTTAAYLALKEGHRQIAAIFFTNNFFIIGKEELEMLLMVASFKGDVDTIKFLINILKVDVNVVDHKTGATPLILAVMQGHTKVVKILLQNKADVYPSVDISPLASAVRTNKTEIIDLLAKYGSSKMVNSPVGPHEITPLESALLHGNVNTFKTLLRHGANPATHTLQFHKRNDVHHIIFTVLLANTTVRKEKFLKALLDHGVSPDQRLDERPQDLTPLLVAIIKNETESVKTLLEYGARTDATVNKVTPLNSAVWHRMPHMVENLLRHGADVEHSDFSLTPLNLAVMNNYTDVVDVLLKHNASVHAVTVAGTPLYLASYYGHTDIARLLIKYKANVEMGGNKLNATPLVVASERGHVEMVKLLLRHGANPNAAVVIFTNSTEVPRLRNLLFYAFKGTAELLIREYDYKEKGEDNIFYKTTPLSQAIGKNHTRIVKILLRYGANTETKCRFLKAELRALFLASLQGKVEIVRVLLQHGADVNAKSTEGITALHVATSVKPPNSVYIIDLLLQHGADLFIRDDYGETALETITHLINRETEVVLNTYQTTEYGETVLRVGESIIRSIELKSKSN